MRWFKHLSTARNDPFVRELMHRFGSDGYVCWFGTIEIIAEKLKAKPGKKPDPTILASPRFFSEQLLLRIDRLEIMYEYLKKSKRASFRRTKEQWRVEIPKVLVFMDEHTNRVTHFTRELLGSHSGTEQEQQQEQDVVVVTGGEIGTKSLTSGNGAPTDPVRSRKRSLELLLSCGVRKSVAQALSCEHPFERVYAVIEAAQKGKNPAGYARTALEKGWKVKAVPVPTAILAEIAAETAGLFRSSLRPKDPAFARRPGESDDDWLKRGLELRRKQGRDNEPTKAGTDKAGANEAPRAGSSSESGDG